MESAPLRLNLTVDLRKLATFRRRRETSIPVQNRSGPTGTDRFT